MSQIKVTPIDHMGSDLSVVNAARVSFGKKSELEEDSHGVWHLKDKDAKLIRYLAKHKHLSPFGHAFASFHIKAPIFVRAQLVKHKFLRVNEISRRYVDDNIEFYQPDQWRGRSKDKKQGSSDWSVDAKHFPLLVQTQETTWDGPTYTPYYEVCIEQYNHLLSCNFAPEMARMVLPQSLMTEWFWSGSLDAFGAMCQLRLKEDTQYESRLVAQQVDQEMSKLFPVSWSALTQED
jgi:thymidylate synthase (FAD)